MVAEAPSSPSHELTIPDALPVLPLRGGMVVLPLAVMPLLVGQPRSVQLIDDIMRKDRVVVQGLERVRLIDLVATEPYFVARVKLAPDQAPSGVEMEALRRAAIDLFRRVVALVDEVPDETAQAAETVSNPRQLVYLIASVLPMPAATRQEATVRELGQKITSETQQRMSKTQRDFFLREQLHSIQHELGEGDENPELAQLRQRLEEAQLPEEAQREAQRELDRLAAIPPVSPEYGLIRTYLDWMVSLPWNALTGGDIDVRRAREVLDADHYDLAKVKDRILEHLAVEKLRRERFAARH